MSQDKQGPSLESFFSSISDANRKLMEQFVGNFAGMKLPDGETQPVCQHVGRRRQKRIATGKMQTNLYQQQMNLWMNFPRPESAGSRQPDPSDKRFAAAEWNDHPFFNLLKQNYLFASKWLTEMVDGVPIDAHQKERMSFFTKQYLDALEPDQLRHDQPGSAQARHRNQG